jgi:hypothetical protein
MGRSEVNPSILRQAGRGMLLRRRKMFRFKLIALMALVPFVFGLAAVGDALAGEKFKTRLVHYSTKWQQIEIGDRNGHIFGLSEGKGICTNMLGQPFTDGWATRQLGFLGLDTKAGTWTGYGHTEYADPDGDKIYSRWEGGKKEGRDRSEGRLVLIKGTGKWEGIKGSAAWVSYDKEDRWYSDQEGEVDGRTVGKLPEPPSKRAPQRKRPAEFGRKRPSSVLSHISVVSKFHISIVSHRVYEGLRKEAGS